MENRFLTNKVVIKNCPNYYRIINEEFSELDIISDKLIKMYQEYIFSVDIKNKTIMKKVNKLDRAITRYFDDREFKKILTNSLVSLKVKKGEKNVLLIIIENILKEYEKYLEGFTRNLYIPKWI